MRLRGVKGDGVESVSPGHTAQVEVTLTKPVAMEHGLRFTIRRGGRAIGAGVVSKIIT
ncbi:MULTISPECIES: hypothetical protein [unclassified Kitasatospora]|uniref:EF-Tu C-terminal domain-related protein n=1 Tax=unclassified Kitasatospora TaxID=2633591 RepID=UPI0038039A26